MTTRPGTTGTEAAAALEAVRGGDAAAPGDAEPDAVVVSRETIEPTYLAAIQHLPGRQRAVLILRDALGWPAREVASLLEATVASANSALQRARSTMRARLPEHRLDRPAVTGPTDQERAVLRRPRRAAPPAPRPRRAADRGRPDRRDHHRHARAPGGLRLPPTLG